MSGRFDFTSIGAAMSKGLRETLAQQEAERLRAEDLKLRQKESQRQDEELGLRKEDAKVVQAQRAALVAETVRKTQEANAERLTPGQELTGMENIPSEMKVDQVIAPRTLPMTVGTPTATDAGTEPWRTQITEGGSPTISAPIQPVSIMSPTKTGKQEFTGTPAQKKFKTLMEDVNVPDEVKSYMKARQVAGDENLPYQLFEGVKNKPIVRVSHDRKTLELFNKGTWDPITGDIPKDAQLIVEPADGQQGGQPYFIPVTTAQGLYAFNARTGGLDTRLGDLKPGEGAGKDLSSAMGVNQQIDTIKKEFNPAKIGVIAGRLGNLNQAVWGSDPEYARFKNELTTLGNTIIQLRTGAQMSVQEAQRILSEIANEKLPVSTFVARLDRMEELYDQYLANRAKVAYGRTTKEDIDKMVAPPAGASVAGKKPTEGMTPAQKLEYYKNLGKP